MRLNGSLVFSIDGSEMLQPPDPSMTLIEVLSRPSPSLLHPSTFPTFIPIPALLHHKFFHTFIPVTSPPSSQSLLHLHPSTLPSFTPTISSSLSQYPLRISPQLPPSPPCILPLDGTIPILPCTSPPLCSPPQRLPSHVSSVAVNEEMTLKLDRRNTLSISNQMVTKAGMAMRTPH